MLLLDKHGALDRFQFESMRFAVKMFSSMSLADALNLIHAELPSHFKEALPKLVKSEGRVQIKGFSVAKIGGLESLKLTFQKRLPKCSEAQKENLEKRIE